ncbi:MAG: hypothetical protein LBS08_06285 [Candidatus Symbiothrix sp.]|jgi:hypothetical protein|nr:hypothetical protein [Candidatus Symbiothrix sp.]
MKVSISKKGYTLSGISPEELSTIKYLLGNIRKRCFLTPKNEDGNYCSGSDFLAILNEDELNEFRAFMDEWEDKPW